jgi:hypothetical protein
MHDGSHDSRNGLVNCCWFLFLCMLLQAHCFPGQYWLTCRSGGCWVSLFVPHVVLLQSCKTDRGRAVRLGRVAERIPAGPLRFISHFSYSIIVTSQGGRWRPLHAGRARRQLRDRANLHSRSSELSTMNEHKKTKQFAPTKYKKSDEQFLQASISGIIVGTLSVRGEASRRMHPPVP